LPLPCLWHILSPLVLCLTSILLVSDLHGIGVYSSL
jgi:hypothetical protein